MGETPDELTRDIEDTRRDLTANVDALTDRVSPSRVMERQVEKSKQGLSRVKEKVMGSSSDDSGPSVADKAKGVAGSVSDTASSLTGSVSDKAQGAGGSVSDKAHGVADAVSGAPARAKQSTQGNPLAAGLIAFGAGWLVSSLIPASQREAQAASTVVDAAKEHAGPVKEKLADVGSQVGDQMKEKVTDAVDQVKSSAQDSAQNVKGEARSSASTVAEEAPGPTPSGL